MSLSDFLDDLFGGGNSSSSRMDAPEKYTGGYSGRAPTRSVRPQYRPETYTVPSGGGGGGDNDTRTIPFADAKPVTFQQAGLKIPKDKDLNYDNVPYFSGESIRPKNMVFKDGVYVLDPTNKRGLADFMRTRKEMPKAMATDLRLGLGSLSGVEGFTKALEGLGFGTFRDDDGNPSAEALQAYTNFRQTSENTAKAAASASDGDDFYGNYDPCPEGYRTDPVTGMCVPVMGVAYETAPSAPAQYQGNFVGDPFPTIASGGGMTSPVVPSMDYTQPMNFTSPTISPPVPQGIAGIPLTPIMG